MKTFGGVGVAGGRGHAVFGGGAAHEVEVEVAERDELHGEVVQRREDVAVAVRAMPMTATRRRLWKSRW